MMRNHDPTSCRLCERVPAKCYRRHWKHEPKPGYWHVIADGPDLAARLPRQAYFVTMLRYRLGLNSTIAQYQGPLYFECDAEHSVTAFEDLRLCIELLHVEYDCPHESIRVWHSGNRGPHVTIPPVIFGAEAGHPLLSRIYAAMIERLFPPRIAATLDRTVYSIGKGRIWRLPNRRRSDTDRYKVPLSMREVLHQPHAELEALTLRPRKGIFWPAEDEFTPCSELVQLYQETTTAIERAASAPPRVTRDESAPRGDVDVLLRHCAFIRHCRDDATTLTEPEWYAMVSNVARCADGPAAVHALSALYSTYLPQETDAKIEHAVKDSGPYTCAVIQAMGFQGCPPGGCGVKAPIALSRQLGTGGHEVMPRWFPLRPYQPYGGYRGYTKWVVHG